MILIKMKHTLSIFLVGLTICGFTSGHLKEKIEEIKEEKAAAKEAHKESDNADIQALLYPFPSNCNCCNQSRCPCAHLCTPKYLLKGILTLQAHKCDCKKCCCKEVCNDHPCKECTIDCCKHCDCKLDCVDCGCKSCKHGK